MRPYSLKLNDEEDEKLREQANTEGLYPHGLARSIIRYGLGLPVPSSVVRMIEENHRQNVAA